MSSEPMAMIADILSGILIVAGSLFVLVGAIGLIRLPDVYTRIHGVSLIDTAGALLIVVGLMIQAGPTLIAVKLLFIFLLIFFTGPVATHAVAQAALTRGVEPKLTDDRRPSPGRGDGAGDPPPLDE